MGTNDPIRRRVVRAGLCAALALWAAAALASGPTELRASQVEGVVLDAAGEPVSGASVSFQWRFDEKGATPLFDEGVTDADGRFSVGVVFPLGGRPVALLALDRERKRGSLVQAFAGKPVTMNLEPLRTVTASVIGTETGAKVPAEMAIYTGNAKPRFAWVLAPKGDLNVALPSGDMWYGIKSAGRIEVRALLKLENADGPLAIGSIPLDPRGGNLPGK